MANNPLDYLIQNPDAMRYALLQDASYKGGGAAVKMADAGSVTKALEALQRVGQGASKAEQANYELANPYGTNYERFVPEANAFSVNAKPASQAYTQYDVPRVGESGGIAPLPRTIYDDRMEELNKQLDRGAKPDWMTDTDFAQSQVDRGRGGGNIIRALGSILSAPEHVTGSSMGLDPMLGLIGKMGELHSVPKAGRYMASRAAPFVKSTAEMANELYASGQMRGMVSPNAYVVKPYYHGSDIKGLKVLDPEASNGRRSNGSSVWVNPVDLQAASYAKKKSGSLYEVPLDTEGFAIVDADFTGNKSISPGAVIQHSNGEVTPVSALGNKVTTDDIAAHSRAKGDPGVRILNVGDMGSGRLHTDATHGESVAVHSPVEVKSERNVKDLISENSEQSVNSKELTQNTSLTPENLDALREYAAGLSNSKIGGYSQIQNILRKGSPTYKDVDPVLSSKIVEDLVDAFANSKTELPQTVYRGTRVRKGSEREELLKLQPGSIYLDKGLTSTSKDKSVVARKFSNKLNRSDTLVNFVIDVPEGSSAIDLQQALGKEHGHEKEIALAPSTKFEVTKVSTGKGFSPETGNPPEQGVRTIHMKVIKEKPGGYARGGGAVRMAGGGQVMSEAIGGQVQRFEDGGQASQDQMRYELANSPVMQATPRSPMQDFIGMAGGYMDRAGKFVSEAIEPTAEKHPVKHFLANMLLADSLKSAGTLMQDLTGTAREADENNPVRGIIDKDWRKLSTGTAPLFDPRALDLAGFVTPVVKGATKLAGAGAKAITPFAKSTAEMAAELYGSGKMTGMIVPNAYMAEPIYNAQRGITPDTIRLYHGSPDEKLTEVNDKGLFGGIFGSVDKQAAESHGEHLYYADISKDNLLSHYDLNYEIPYEKVNEALLKARPDLRNNPELHEKVWNTVISDRGQDIRNLSDSDLMEMFHISDYAEAGWDAQKLRGKISKNLGYHAVELEDEHGTTYLINSGTKLNKNGVANMAKGGKVSFASNVDAMRNELTKAK